MKQASALRRALALIAGGASALLAACNGGGPISPGASAPSAPVGPVTPAQVASAGMATPMGPGGVPTPPAASAARTPREYRRDAAAHLYRLNEARIYKGRLPAHLYAIGVLEVQLDSRGRPQRLHWLRAPRHAPEVVAEIERTVRNATPFPAPARLGRVTYTETWLWDRSGRFQLDTLTEGQD